nr:phospholipase A1-II 1-like [Ipomoea batatas]
MAAPTGEALITDAASKNIGLCRYARKNLLANTGAVREEVARLVERYKDEKVSITVTGASLGASMATLNATDMAVNPFKPDIPVTAFLFASPKVGDENFKNAFASQPNLRGLRITDVKDNVPTLPPFGLPVGQLFPVIFYQDVGVGFMIEPRFLAITIRCFICMESMDSKGLKEGSSLKEILILPKLISIKML